MPQQVFIESRNQTIEFPDDATQEEIDSFVAAEFPRTGKDVAYDLSKFSDVADMRDFIAMMPDEDYVKLNNYKADEKLSWGELAGIAGEALGTIVGDAVKGVGSAVTRAGDGVMESAARGVGAGTIDLVNLGQKLITPNKRIPSLEEFLKQTKDQPLETIADETSPFGRKQIPNTQEDYKALIDRQRFEELQSLAMAEASEKLIKGAPIEEVARGASYLDAITLAGLGKNIAKAGLKTIFKKTAQAPIQTTAKIGAETASAAGTTAGRNAEAFAQKVGEGARKAGFTGVEFGAKAVKGVADLGKTVMDAADALGLKNPLVRAGIGAAIGTQEGGERGGVIGGIIGSAAPVIARKGLGLVSGTADFIGAAAKVGKSGPSRVGFLERMAQAADISPEARQFAEKVLFAQPFMQAAGEVARQTALRSLIGVPVGAALGYATDGERGAAAGAGSGLAVSGLSGTLATAIDTIKYIAGKSTARSQRNAMGDIRSFVNNIPDDVARTGYAEFMDKAIQVAGPERAADMLDHLRLAEGMGATVEVVPPSKRKDAFNAFDYSGQGGGKIIINPDRLTPGSVAHETFHQLLNVGVKTELGNALREVYMPQRDADGNIIKQGLFDDAEFAKRAAQLANEYKNNPEGYRMALDYANKLKDPAGVSPEALDQARMFVIDEMTAEYSENFMGRGRPGVFNPDRLPLWHRNLLRQIDDKILNTITDKIYADKNIKGPNTPFFTDENGKPVRVPQLDKVLNRAFANKMARDRGQTAGKMGRPSEVVIPTKPRDLVAFAQATFGATRDILGTDEKGNPYVLTDKERKATTAADFEAAKEAFQSLPQEAKATVQVTNKTGQPVDINSKSAQIRITQQTPNDVFEAFLRVAKERGMGNQQIANMRQIYQAITAEEGPTFNTVNNPVYKFNARTGGMRAEVRPPTRQEVYPLGIRINSAGGFNVDYIDMSRVKANAQKILDNPNYKGIWSGMDDFMGDFKRSLKNLSDQNAIPSAELLGKGNEKIGAVKRDLIAEAMNVTLPKRLEYTNQPVIDPLTLLTSEGKERRVGGSAIRDFRIERLTEVIPTDERMKVVQENFYDRLVSRFQPSAFVRETLPNGETLTNPDGYRILKKTDGKLFRVYDDNGALLGTSSSEDAAMKKAQSDYAKKQAKEEPAIKRFQFAGESAQMPQFMRDSLETAKSMAAAGKSSAEIRAITGWFPGNYDDKMRWEVPDNESLIKGTAKADELVSRAWKKVTQPRQPDSPTAQLQDILRHPALFSAYPEAAAIPVVADINLSSYGAIGPMAGFDGNVIQVNGNLSGDRLKSTLLHEVQHWIQDKEGFAKGGSLEMAQQLIDIGKQAVEERSWRSEIKRSGSENAAIKEYKETGLEDLIPKKRPLANKTDSEIASLAKLTDEKVSRNPIEAYRKFAGEIESRDIQARQNFTPEQRKAIEPYSSENIAKEEAIVLKEESPAIKRFQPVSPEQDAGIFEQKGLENHVLKPILGAAFTFNPKKINEKYIKQAKEVADRLGGGRAFNPSRKSGDDGQARVQMDGLRSSELRTKQEIDARILQDSPNGVIKEGGEHFSFIPDNKEYVIKVTKPSETGTSGFIVDEYVAPGFDQKQFRFLNFRRASVSEYVARTALFSKLFNIPWQVVEVAQDADGQPVIYSMMKKIEGERLKDTNPSDRKAVEKLMASKGFKFLGDSYLTFRKGSEPLEGITFFNAKTGVLISDAEPRNFVRTPSGKIEPVDLMINVFPTEYNIRFQPDSASPSILNGSNGTRIIKSPSGKFRVYSATGALLGIRDTEEAAKKLATK